MSRRRSTNLAAALAVPLLLGVGCGTQTNVAAPGDGPTKQAKTGPAGDRAPDRLFSIRATVLQNPGSGPKLCDAVMESYPPQCHGPLIDGWDWSAVRHEAANGTTWGEYVVTGSYDGKTFTLTEPAQLDRGRRGGSSDTGVTTPCPATQDGEPPEWGWSFCLPMTGERNAERRNPPEPLPELPDVATDSGTSQQGGSGAS